MSAESENGQLARQILDEYYREFQERNPNLKVFSAHLHMDEATPHLHIDFVPFTTGSKRGLDTRVSLKQALATQGFKGGTRGDTEWNQWISAEKSALAFVMERHGIEWEHKGTHEKHLSVLDYKKQERATELEQLGAKIEEKQAEFNVLSERVLNYYNLLTSGKLNSYLTGIEKQAQDLFLRLVKDLAEQENVTEELKTTDMMLWVQKMNNVRNRATEIVNVDIIYKV